MIEKTKGKFSENKLSLPHTKNKK